MNSFQEFLKQFGSNTIFLEAAPYSDDEQFFIYRLNQKLGKLAVDAKHYGIKIVSKPSFMVKTGNNPTGKTFYPDQVEDAAKYITDIINHGREQEARSGRGQQMFDSKNGGRVAKPASTNAQFDPTNGKPLRSFTPKKPWWKFN